MSTLELEKVKTPVELTVNARMHPYAHDTVVAHFPAGSSVREIVGPNTTFVRVEIGGMTVPEEWWAHIRPKPHVAIIITRMPQGGSVKSILRLVAFAALAVGVALISGGALAGLAFIPGNLFGVGTLSAGLLAAGVGFAGALAINALIPAQTPTNVSSSSVDTLRSITGTSNQISRYGAVPVVIGEMDFFPPYAALPATEYVGDDQYLRCLFDLGFGDPSIANLRIGDTDIADYTDVETEIGTNPSLFSQDIIEENLGLPVAESTNFTRTTGINADEGGVDLSFSAGLFGLDGDGNATTVSVPVQVEFRLNGSSGAWTDFHTTSTFSISFPGAIFGGGFLNIRNSTKKAVRVGLRWKFPASGEYDVRVTRGVTDWGSSSSDSRIADMTWTVLRTIRYMMPSTTGTKKLAMRIKASDQLNGTIQQFKVTASQPIPVWNPSLSVWQTEVSTNPAYIFRWLLKDCPANPRRVDISRLIDADIKAWGAECDAKNFTYSTVVDQVTTVQAMLKDVCAAGRASLAMRDSKYTVVRDVEQTVPVQMFTPRNSWGYTGTRLFADAVHALRVQFTNPEAAYQQDERIVYDDGYGDAAMVAADTSGHTLLATAFDTYSIPGCVDADGAWRLGRYHLAVLRLRPTTHAFSVDIENLVCSRGDLVHFVHDVLGNGQGARIKSMTFAPVDGHLTSITTDEAFDPVTGVDYAITARMQTGAQFGTPVTFPTLDPGQNTMTVPPPAHEVLAYPQVGDLLIFGSDEQETLSLLVSRIEPGADFSAKLTCVDAAPAVLTADAGDPPAWSSQITGQPWEEPPAAPDLLLINSSQYISSGTDAGDTLPVMQIVAGGNWSAVQRVAVDHIDIRYRFNDPVGAWTNLVIPRGESSVESGVVVRGAAYQVEARSVAITGGTSAWVSQTHTIADASIAPLQPLGLSANSVADGVQLKWHITGTQRSDVEYEVQRAEDDGTGLAADAGTWANLTNCKTLNFTDGITDRVIRWYRCRAVTFAGVTSAWSNEISSKNKAVDDGAAVGALNPGLSYASTASTITLSWTVDGYYLDQSNTSFGGSGSQILTGLSDSTDYNAYPFWSRAGAAVGAVETGGVGSPSWAHIGTDRLWTAEQCKQGNIALTSAPFAMATTSIGSPPGGGSGGGDGGCLRRDMLVREQVRGVIRVDDVARGDHLWSRGDVWLEVVEQPAPRPHDIWIALSTNNGVESLVITAAHPFVSADDESEVRAHSLTLQHALHCPTGVAHPTKIELVKSVDTKVAISLEHPHVFFASADGEHWIETHNTFVKTE